MQREKIIDKTDTELTNKVLVGMYLSSILLLLMGLSGLYGTPMIQLRVPQEKQMPVGAVLDWNVRVRSGLCCRDVFVLPRAEDCLRWQLH